MPVNTQHPDYVAMTPVWRACRDVAGGQRAVHKAGELYLPRLKGEIDADYEARKARALFFNATWRTIAGLGGMLMRKDPVVRVSPAAEKMLEDVTQSGMSLVDVAAAVVENCLTVGRDGILVDYPRRSGEGLTVADAEALNLRPKFCLYRAEKIINWATSWILDKNVLSRVVLHEVTPLPSADEFASESEDRWRVLDLAPYVDPANPTASAPLAYRVRVFRRGRDGKDELVEGPFFPLMKGAPIPFIPFVFIGVDNTTPAVDDPPLVDLVYTNLSHYQSTADVEHGAHKTALPQPYATGIDPTPAADSSGNGARPVFYIGGGEVWLHPDVNGKFGMLEYTGQGLEAIETRLVRKEAHMAVLGARMLEDQKKGIEAAETAGLHRSGEHATLASQGKTVSAGIRQALAWFDQWAGGSGDVAFELNSEFLPANLSAQDLAALVAAWQSGALSGEELFVKLQKGGVIRETTDYETHEAQIENAAPRLSAAPPNNTPPAE